MKKIILSIVATLLVAGMVVFASNWTTKKADNCCAKNSTCCPGNSCCQDK